MNDGSVKSVRNKARSHTDYASELRSTGGIVKAEGLGDGPSHGKVAIAKLRLTLPPMRSSEYEELNYSRHQRPK